MHTIPPIVKFDYYFSVNKAISPYEDIPIAPLVVNGLKLDSLCKFCCGYGDAFG